MKVLHINKGQIGGAAWCAMRINKALTQAGLESRMLFAEGQTMPDGVMGEIAKRDNSFWTYHAFLKRIKVFLIWHSLYWKQDAEKLRFLLYKKNKTHLYLHQPLSDYKNIAHHPLVEWADIVHLHWVPDFVDYPSFFKEVKKPIVWTLHDKYPAVGVQHFGSQLFQPLPHELEDIDSQCKMIKRNGVKKSYNLNLIAISEMMVEVCKNSYVLKGFPVTLIHNGVDANLFHPYDKLSCRKELGLLAEARVFLFSSYSINDERKGLDRIISALEKVNIPNKLLVCIGNLPFGYSVPDYTFPIIVTGELKNQIRISKYYSAADYFLQGSYEEGFAQTPLEAMACGTPVISTPCSGAKDLIRPFNGVICNGYDSDAICEGIKTALTRQYDPVQIRNHIIENYDYSIIAKQYIKLYESVIKGTK